jgi:hypothetical protein
MKAALEPYIPISSDVLGAVMSGQEPGNSRERKPIGPSVAATVRLRRACAWPNGLLEGLSILTNATRRRHPSVRMATARSG